MIYRIAAGVTFILWGASQVGVGIPIVVIAIFAIIAGIALLAGI